MTLKALGKQESPQGSQGGSVPSSSSNGAKLPKLHIKRFAGDPKNWQTFRDSFSSVVHKNASISNVASLIIYEVYWMARL